MEVGSGDGQMAAATRVPPSPQGEIEEAFPGWEEPHKPALEGLPSVGGSEGASEGAKGKSRNSKQNGRSHDRVTILRRPDGAGMLASHHAAYSGDEKKLRSIHEDGAGDTLIAADKVTRRTAKDAIMTLSAPKKRHSSCPALRRNLPPAGRPVDTRALRLRQRQAPGALGAGNLVRTSLARRRRQGREVPFPCCGHKGGAAVSPGHPGRGRELHAPHRRFPRPNTRALRRPERQRRVPEGGASGAGAVVPLPLRRRCLRKDARRLRDPVQQGGVREAHYDRHAVPGGHEPR
mmetsp:Transcript_33589/g.78765  ORF Transcript_33589/g.78765 Transcript_33589/m.78765 type:complete len:291 (+) Transcript_33589:146-1018(+)